MGSSSPLAFGNYPNRMNWTSLAHRVYTQPQEFGPVRMACPSQPSLVSVLVGAAFGRAFLGEKFGPGRAVGAVLIFGGLVCLSLAE